MKAASVLKVPPEKLPSVAERFFEEWKQLRKETERLQSEIADLELERLRGQKQEIEGVNVIVAVVPEPTPKGLRSISSKLVEDGNPTALISGSSGSFIYEVPAHLSDRLNAAEWLQHVAKKCGGRGGGTATLAQGGGITIELVDKAREEGLKFVKERLKKK